MTRLERELSGELGQYWKADAEKRIAEVAKKFEEGKITVDENGVARNCIGRPVMSDMAELLIHAGIQFDAEATGRAVSEAARKTIEDYKANATDYTEEELYEMRSAFGKGTTVVDLFTGKEVIL